MLLKVASILAAISVLTSAALAEDAANPVPAPTKAPCLVNGTPVDPATLAAALDLQKAAGTQDRMEETIQLMLPPVLNLMKQNDKEIPQTALDAFKDAFLTEMKAGLPEVLNETACVAARHYTLAELQRISAFYASDIGQKMLKESPEVMKETMAIGMAWGGAAGKAAAEHAIARLRSNGVKI
jgi:hypothetical protein